MESFKDVVGHRYIIQYIQNVVREDMVSHAYIINGAKGCGKKMLSRLFAMTLLCENSDSEPCGKCHSCIQAESDNHPDLIWVTHKAENSIGVDDIREQVNNTIDIKPYQSRYKIYIIPQADTMTVQAQNALLKTIEEPPRYAVIILLTQNAEALLSTITSRCVVLKLRNIKDTLIRKYLMEKLEIPDYKADVCTAYAQGNLGKAMRLAQSEDFEKLHDEVIDLLKNIHGMDISQVVDAVNRASEIRKAKNTEFGIEDYLDIIMIWYRDLLIYKATRDVEKVVLKDQIEYMKEQAKTSSYEGIEAILEGLESAKARLKANVNFELVMELLFLTIKEN